MDRKQFLKLAGLTAVAGAVGKLPLVAKAAGGGHSGGRPQGYGKRYAMAIDLGKCRQEKGCTRCFDACHAEHNVPDFGNKKDEIKWIWNEPYGNVFHEQGHEFLPEELRQGPAPILCNHCDSPACTKVCPVQATWKRKSDGVVMMDWHRCIGCRYCIAACPYGARSFNYRDPRPFIKKLRKEFPTRTKGVVEKCNFCEERLAKGQGPSCVEACKAQALTFGNLDEPDSEIRKLLSSRYTVRRKAGLGTGPQVYYVMS
ncbi:MAG: sulfate reduction electron transfer complex DsrMKJOP subunit DsrO [Elusimicrobiota bacterium]